MRILLLLAVLGCEVPEAQTTPLPIVPAPPLVFGSDGWCPEPARPPRKPITGLFEITTDLRSVKPMRKGGFDSEQTSFDRDGRYQATRVWVALVPGIANGKLELSTSPTSCHETNAGCFAGYWSRPAEVKLIDPTPVHSCIRYAFPFDGQIVIGFADELRTYSWHDATASVGSRHAAPPLQLLEVHEGRPLLEEADGTLWTTTATAAPALTRVGKLPKHARLASTDNHGLLLAYTDDGLYAVDAKTYVERWHVDGEITSVSSQDIPLTHFVLSIDRGAKPGVDLRTLDETGKETKHIRIKNGSVDEAYLESTYDKIRPDRYQTILLVLASD